MWIVEDWAGNRVFPENSFDTFELGWAFIHEHSPEEDWEDLFVTTAFPALGVPETRPPRRKK